MKAHLITAMFPYQLSLGTLLQPLQSSILAHSLSSESPTLISLYPSLSCRPLSSLFVNRVLFLLHFLTLVQFLPLPLPPHSQPPPSDTFQVPPAPHPPHPPGVNSVHTQLVNFLYFYSKFSTSRVLLCFLCPQPHLIVTLKGKKEKNDRMNTFKCIILLLNIFLYKEESTMHHESPTWLG